MGRDRSRSHRFRNAMLQGRGALALVSGAIVFVGAGVVPATASAQQSATAPSLVFDGVTVVDVEQGKLVPDQRVVVVGNRIQAVGDAGRVELPNGARVEEARGKYLIPGLWDLHTHPDRFADLFYPLFLANGVTGIRNAASPVPLDTLIQMRREIVAGTRVGPPRQVLSGPSMNEQAQCVEEPWHICVADSADVQRVVDSIKAAGADMLKTYELSREMYFVIAAAARRAGISFGGHVPPGSAFEASDSGAVILDHLQQAGGLPGLCLQKQQPSIDQCQALAERFRQRGTWWVPTLAHIALLLDHFAIAKRPPLLGRLYEVAEQYWSGVMPSSHWLGSVVNPGVPNLPWDLDLSLAQRVGLPILAGTDVGFDGSDKTLLQRIPPGFTLHEELAMYVAGGLTPLEALRSATLNPAKFLHATDSLGTVAPGKLADLVLLDADPLADITNTTMIRAVVANGRYFDRAALDQLLADAQVKAKEF